MSNNLIQIIRKHLSLNSFNFLNFFNIHNSITPIIL